ncbi:hypothetical protein RvY_02510 [Ramazzottius varieornatus]|uniref:Uncharacterized protein n=1 Tax=Ramazzottius varieornatus TaxID=947166 RepID=A0A1D1UKQ8_RAMVA|nr:hypothetical protein RvY_02510 [Ramazzottius varieornatus]
MRQKWNVRSGQVMSYGVVSCHRPQPVGSGRLPLLFQDSFHASPRYPRHQPFLDESVYTLMDSMQYLNGFYPGDFHLEGRNSKVQVLEFRFLEALKICLSLLRLPGGPFWPVSLLSA